MEDDIPDVEEVRKKMIEGIIERRRWEQEVCR